jgi:hypothetical protein
MVAIDTRRNGNKIYGFGFGKKLFRGTWFLVTPPATPQHTQVILPFFMLLLFSSRLGKRSCAATIFSEDK